MVSLEEFAKNSPALSLPDEVLDMLLSEEPSTLLYGAGGSGKVFVLPAAVVPVDAT